MTAATYPADVPNIALMGKAGAGKDTVAQLLQTRFRLGYQRVALADPLKDIASILWGQEARKDRTKLQGLGVAVRDIEPDTWVDLLLRSIARNDRDSLRPTRHVVTDVRFPNEFRTLKAAGFLMVSVYAPLQTRVDRLKRNGKLQNEDQLNHPSETALDYREFSADWVLINEAGEDELVEQITKVLDRVRA